MAEDLELSDSGEPGAPSDAKGATRKSRVSEAGRPSRILEEADTSERGSVRHSRVSEAGRSSRILEDADASERGSVRQSRASEAGRQSRIFEDVDASERGSVRKSRVTLEDPDASEQGSPRTPARRSKPVSPSDHYSNALDALKAIPEPDLSVLSPVRKPRQKPGQWDGRVSGLSVKEYRALKWGVEAGHKMCSRSGPRYSIRGSCLTRSRSAHDSLLDSDIIKSWNTLQPTGASYSMGRLPIVQPPERTPGPSRYTQKGIIGSSSHPTFSKDLGRQFGRERLLCNDEAAPAPGDYDVSGFEKIGRYNLAATPVIQGREAWNEPPIAPGPAPGDYQFDEIFKNGKHTGMRLTIQGKTEITQPPTGAAATRLRKRLDTIRRKHQFEKDIDFGKISPILLALEAPQLMEICKKLEDNATLIRDPNTFLVAAAMKKLGNSGGYGARKPVQPGPTHYCCPGAGGLDYAHIDKPPEWSFNREHRGLVT